MTLFVYAVTLKNIFWLLKPVILAAEGRTSQVLLFRSNVKSYFFSSFVLRSFEQVYSSQLHTNSIFLATERVNYTAIAQSWTQIVIFIVNLSIRCLSEIKSYLLKHCLALKCMLLKLVIFRFYIIAYQMMVIKSCIFHLHFSAIDNFCNAVIMR